MCDEVPCKKLHEEEPKKSEKQYKRIWRLESDLKRAERKLFQYELGLLIREKLMLAERRMGHGYDEETFDANMRNKYEDADELELKENNYHYKIWQYIIHFSNSMHYRRRTLQSNYGHESDRQKCHEFCMNMKIACTLFDSKICFGIMEQVVIGNKKIYHELTKEEIFDNLSEMLLLGRSQIEDMIKFLEIWDDL